MTSERTKIGIIGAGRVGVDWHLPDIRTAGGEVTALADVVPGRAARLAADRGVPLAFDDYRALLALDEIDAVAICTPPVNHEEIAVAALRAGKHVYLEKPPAMNAAEMARITKVARQADRLLMSGSNSVYYNEMQALKRAIDAGELGNIYYVEALKAIRRNYKKGWHRRRDIAGGGVTMDSSAHRLDLVLYLLGTPRVLSVTARTYDHFANRPLPVAAPVGYQLMDVEEGLADMSTQSDIEDTLIAFIQFEGGCTLVLRDMSNANIAADWSLRLAGTKGGASLLPLRFFGETSDGLPTETIPEVPANPEGSHVPIYRHLLSCIRDGCETQSPGERGVVLMRIVDAIYASATRGGRQIVLDQT